ncbi:MAG: glycosyltransferase family 4 protein [Anaerolineae bacterium]|nr:glycosyltransferase family 4 protein [Anaerolineae bacterium]
MVRATFVMEQHLGHRAYYENLRGFIDGVPGVETTWVPITYSSTKPAAPNWINLFPKSIRGTIYGYLQVRAGLRQSPADVLFFNTQVPAALANQLLKQRHYLLSTDITPVQYDQMAPYYGHQRENGGLLSKYKHAVNTRVLQNAATLVPWSTWTRNSLIQDYQVPPERIVTIAPGVDLEKWSPSAYNREGPLRILFVGNDFYRKGGDVLCEAFKTLPAHSAELHLVTRTPVEMGENVRIYSDMLPNSPELTALYQSADIFVLPTKAEAFGIAAVEASAVGLPVVATAVGGLLDIVIPNKTGFLIEPGNVTALTNCLHQLAQNPDLRRQLGQAARHHAEQNFDAQRNAQRILELLPKPVAHHYLI